MDPSLFCLPFALPTQSLALAVDDGPLFPSFATTSTSTPSPSPAVAVASPAERLLHAEAADQGSAEVGIAGGPGSGSSLGSKARALPSSKYAKAGGTSTRAGEASASSSSSLSTVPASVKGMSGDRVLPPSSQPGAALEPSAVAADLRVLLADDADPDAVRADDLRARLPGLPDRPLLPAHGAGKRREAPETWWLSCGYTQLVQGASPLQSVADGLGGVEGEGEEDDMPTTAGVLTLLANPARPPQPPSAPSSFSSSSSRVTSVAASSQSRPALWGDDEEEDGGADPLRSLEAGIGEGDAALALGSSSPKRATSSSSSAQEAPGGGGADALRAEKLARLRAQAIYESLGADPLVRLAGATALGVPSPAAVAAALEASGDGSAAKPSAASVAAASATAATAAEARERERAADDAMRSMSDAAFDDLLGDLVKASSAAANASSSSSSSSSSAAADPSRSALQTLRTRLGGAPPPASGRQWAVMRRMTDAELVAAEASFTPVHTWPFRLDTFQRESICHMEVEGPASAALFVAAHTSAGKTVVAEYAIAKAAATRTRAVYTSPIKALSNQKFHDLRRLFGGPDGTGVGLITGDVSLNPDAPCLIMTTEVLRSMLYRGDDIVRDISWVIFDEVHYINDAERGLAYEETLLLLPDAVGLIFLSATAPNREDFAEWVGRVKRKKVYVLGTDKRPIPLNHHLYVASDNALSLLMDGAQVDVGDMTGFKASNHKLAAEKLKARIANKGAAGAYGPARGGGGGGGSSSTAGRGGGGVSKRDQQVWTNLVGLLRKQDLLPAIIFSFSKAKCEECAFRGLGGVDFTSNREKSAM
jgi:hypothetical protein